MEANCPSTTTDKTPRWIFAFFFTLVQKGRSLLSSQKLYIVRGRLGGSSVSRSVGFSINMPWSSYYTDIITLAKCFIPSGWLRHMLSVSRGGNVKFGSWSLITQGSIFNNITSSNKYRYQKSQLFGTSKIDVSFCGFFFSFVNRSEYISPD